jgi:hypothetical protein
VLAALGITLFLLYNMYNFAGSFLRTGNIYQLAVFMSFLLLTILSITEGIMLMDYRILGAFFMLYALAERNPEKPAQNA